MKYAIVKVTDGSYNIHTEGYTNLNSAKVEYHNLCKLLWSDIPTKHAVVMIADENLDCVERYKEVITHEA